MGRDTALRPGGLTHPGQESEVLLPALRNRARLTGLPLANACTHLLDMEAIVRRQDQERCASITSMIRHYVA